MARLAGNPEITANTLEIPYPPNDRMARDWISETDRKRDRRSDQVFMITTWTRGEIIGAIGLMCFTREHSPVRKSATGLADPFWNQGYATEAVCPVLDYGFRVMGLHRISAFSLTRNKATGRVMDTGGMRHERVLRQQIQKTGNF